jgi:hypothetical protein
VYFHNQISEGVEKRIRPSWCLESALGGGGEGGRRQCGRSAHDVRVSKALCSHGTELPIHVSLQCETLLRASVSRRFSTC